MEETDGQAERLSAVDFLHKNGVLCKRLDVTKRQFTSVSFLDQH